MPSNPDRSSELFVTRLPLISLPSLLFTSIPLSPALSTTFPMITLPFDFLLGCGALVSDFVTRIPSLPTSCTKQPSARLFDEARNWIPSPLVPETSQSRTRFPCDVHAVPFESL